MSLLFYFKSPNQWIDVGDGASASSGGHYETPYEYRRKRRHGTVEEFMKDKKISRKRDEEKLLSIGAFNWPE